MCENISQSITMEILAPDTYYLWVPEHKVLGSGTYGDVVVINWQGQPAALKIAKSSSNYESLLREANILCCLDGRGGSPKVFGMSNDPPALLMEFKGSQSLMDVMNDYRINLLEVGYKIGC